MTVFEIANICYLDYRYIVRINMNYQLLKTALYDLSNLKTQKITKFKNFPKWPENLPKSAQMLPKEVDPQMFIYIYRKSIIKATTY